MKHSLSSDLKKYIAGFLLATVLTAIPFALVMTNALSGTWLVPVITLCALVQLTVHFYCFLHIDIGKQKREDLNLILFTALILVIMLSGTLWVLGSLGTMR